jgi:hypothetical protein
MFVSCSSNDAHHTVHYINYDVELSRGEVVIRHSGPYPKTFEDSLSHR